MRLSGGAAGAIILSALIASSAHAQSAFGVNTGAPTTGTANQGALASAAYKGEGSMQDDIQRQETVTTRQHPETDPIGITAGSLLIFPKVGVDEKFNDNIYATNTGTITDYITTISPTVRVESNWNNNLLGFTAGSASGIYGQHSTENFNDYNFAANGRFDITRQEYIFVRAGYSELHEDRTSPNNNFGIKPTTYGLTDAQIEFYDKLNRLSFTVDGVFDKYSYSDVGNGLGGFIPNSDRSRTEYSGSVRAGYELQPLLEAYVKGAGGRRDYDHTVGSDGFERSSTGYTVTTGVAMDFGGITFGEIGIGYMSRSYQDARFGTVGGLTGNASLIWNATPLTTVTLNAQRTIEETISFGTPGFEATIASVTVDHELLRNLLLNASGGVTYNQYKQDNGRTDTIPNATVGATYLLNRNVALAAIYSYRKQDDNSSSTLSFTQNLALVRLTLQM